MDFSRAAYSRDLKIAAMRALDAGSSTGEIARKYQLSPHLLDRWRGEWRSKGELAFQNVAYINHNRVLRMMREDNSKRSNDGTCVAVSGKVSHKATILNGARSVE